MEVQSFTDKLENSSFSNSNELNICSSSEEDMESGKSPNRATDFFLYELAHVATSSLILSSDGDSFPLLALTQVACSNLEEANEIKKEGNIRVYSSKSNPNFLDVTPYLLIPQHLAAKELGIPSSTLSKRWKEAAMDRKWPYRTLLKIDKEIDIARKNIESGNFIEAENTLQFLLKRRKEELRTVRIRL